MDPTSTPGGTFSVVQFIVSVVTGILTAIATVFRWITGLKTALEARMEKIEATATDLSTRVKINDTQHEMAMERLAHIEETTRDTNMKLDQLLLKMVHHNNR